ncbi:hypothetical protein B0T17DRAFT_273698 [Bombardia bombarda]|uniref:Uncharacterized protein n=1 Tax=Bombardia bombarda TaxID=252184 RepID=A0AA39X1A9_9PEZI|nr:hypothetical protein B0T17DRAFT_273698 [Bombardia bombarda]
MEDDKEMRIWEIPDLRLTTITEMDLKSSTTLMSYSSFESKLQAPSRSSTLSTEAPAETAARSVRSAFLQRKTAKYAPTWAMTVLTFIITILTVWYSQRTMVDAKQVPSVMQLSPGLTVFMVNTLSQIIAYLAVTLFSDVLEQLRWSLACRPQGILLSSFLAMSRATPITGVFCLCRVRGSHQFWAFQRAFSSIITALLSIIMIANVTFKVVYTPFDNDQAATYTVFGGLVPFGTTGLGNIDLALFPLYATTYSIAFITDPRFVTKVAPVKCSVSSPNCLSLLMPGGMEAVRVYEDPTSKLFSQSLFSGNFSGDYDSIVIHDAPAYQIEYDSIYTVDPDFRWNRTTGFGDCTMYGADIGEGIYVCQHEVGDSIYLGWTICPDTAVVTGSCQTDQSWTNNVKWNTTVSLFSRLATVAYDRSNISILSVEQLSDPLSVKIDAAVASLYINLVLAPIDKKLDWDDRNATYKYSAARFDFTFGLSYILRLYTSEYSTYQDGGIYLLRSFIAVPLQFTTAMRQFGHGNMMPPENTVKATLSQSSYRAIVAGSVIWTFSCFAFPLLLYCAASLIWMGFWGPQSPNISLFPEIDITSKSSVHREPGHDHTFGMDIDPHLEMAGQTLDDLGRLTRTHGMVSGSSMRIVRSIRGKRIYCGSLPGPNGAGSDLIVLLTEEAGRLRCLNRDTKYA